jgi:hypothetical protein
MEVASESRPRWVERHVVENGILGQRLDQKYANRELIHSVKLRRNKYE